VFDHPNFPEIDHFGSSSGSLRTLDPEALNEGHYETGAAGVSRFS
jgi:hypothetical protein